MLQRRWQCAVTTTVHLIGILAQTTKTLINHNSPSTSLDYEVKFGNTELFGAFLHTVMVGIASGENFEAKCQIISGFMGIAGEGFGFNNGEMK